jgi:hypothetical protein
MPATIAPHLQLCQDIIAKKMGLFIVHTLTAI